MEKQICENEPKDGHDLVNYVTPKKFPFECYKSIGQNNSTLITTLWGLKNLILVLLKNILEFAA